MIIIMGKDVSLFFLCLFACPAFFFFLGLWVRLVAVVVVVVLC